MIYKSEEHPSPSITVSSGHRLDSKLTYHSRKTRSGTERAKPGNSPPDFSGISFVSSAGIRNLGLHQLGHVRDGGGGQLRE